MKVDGQLENAQIEILSADPTGDGLYSGRVWFNSTDVKFRTYDGSDTRDLTSEEIIGVSAGDVDLGTFTGSIISDNGSVKEALQELETSLEVGTVQTSFSDSPSYVTDSATYVGVGGSTFVTTVGDASGLVEIQYQFRHEGGEVRMTLDGVPVGAASSKPSAGYVTATIYYAFVGVRGTSYTIELEFKRSGPVTARCDSREATVYFRY